MLCGVGLETGLRFLPAMLALPCLADAALERLTDFVLVPEERAAALAAVFAGECFFADAVVWPGVWLEVCAEPETEVQRARVVARARPHIAAG